MKKIILSAAIAIATLLGANNIASAKADTTTVLHNVKDIREIEVHGNVQVYLTTGNTESVKVYDDYYAQNGLVQEQDNVLRITSYSSRPLVVWVTVAELEKLSASDNATVTSFGKLSTIDLKVNLYNKATAQLDVDALTASVVVSDSASANLTGNIENGDLHYDASASLTTNNLTAANLIKVVNPMPVKRFRRAHSAMIEG